MTSPFSLETELMFVEGHSWTTRDAAEGVICFGATGSGKSSGPLRQIALSFLNNNYGGVVFCAKPDECSTWLEYAKETNRSDDVLLLSELTFNFLDHELKRPSGGGQVSNIVALLLEIVNLGKDKKKSGSTNDEYWQRAVEQLLRNTITLIILAEEPLTLQNIKKVIDSAPRKGDSIETLKLSSYCMKLFDEAIGLGESDNPDFILAADFLKDEFMNLDERTRSNVISSYNVIVDALLRGELRRCFCSPESSLNLTELYKNGKILIVDYSVKEFQQVGLFASAIIKYCFQKVIENREDKTDPNARPIFLYADECQFFAIDHDNHFQTTARSSRILTVYATQNIGNLRDGYGKEKAEALIGNLGTKIFCQNGEHNTNQWAANSIGKELIKRHSKNISDSKSNAERSGHSKSNSTSKGWSEQKDFIIDPHEFTSLTKGGPHSKCRVGFIFWQSGKMLANEKPYIKSFFTQKCKKYCGAQKHYKCQNIKKIGKGADIGENKTFMFSDLIKLLIMVLSGILMLKGFQIILKNNDFQIFNFILFKVYYSSAFLAAGGIFFSFLAEAIFFIVEVIKCKIKGHPRYLGKYTFKTTLYREINIVYVIFCCVLSLLLAKTNPLSYNCLQLLCLWFCIAMILKTAYFLNRKKI